MPGCGGMGFGFDIFPVDPEYRDEHGQLMWCADDQEYVEDDSTLDGDDFLDDLDEQNSESTNGAHHDEEMPFGKPRTDHDDDLPF
jgi:hypothetical protein